MFTSRNVDKGKQTNADVTIDHPPLGFAVGLTAVVHKSRQISFGTRIYYSNSNPTYNLVLKVREKCQSAFTCPCQLS